VTVASVGEQNAVNEILTRKPESTRNTGELGKDEFLKLLITQLKYQDPLQPMDDKEFIAQIAQFSSLEQMKNMSTSIENMKAYSLIGKLVSATYTDEKTGEIKSAEGEVEGVRVISGNVYLTVNGQDIPADKVQEVSSFSEMITQITLSEALNQVKYLNTSLDAMKALGLVGKNIRAEMTDDETGGNITLEGVVTGVSIVSGRVYLQVDGKNIPVDKLDAITFASDGTGEEAVEEDGDTGAVTPEDSSGEVDGDGYQ
jgi:flagellar basal-body rod modification protein FlgD